MLAFGSLLLRELDLGVFLLLLLLDLFSELLFLQLLLLDFLLLELLLFGQFFFPLLLQLPSHFLLPLLISLLFPLSLEVLLLLLLLLFGIEEVDQGIEVRRLVQILGVIFGLLLSRDIHFQRRSISSGFLLIIPTLILRIHRIGTKLTRLF